MVQATSKTSIKLACRMPVIILAGTLVAACGSGSDDSPDMGLGDGAGAGVGSANDQTVDLTVRNRSTTFMRMSVDSSDPNGNSVAANCGGSYEDATASLDLVEQPGKTGVTITIANAKPNTLFTTWLRLKGTTDDGVSFGGNPLTGAGSTPLAPSSALPDLLAATGAGNGTEETPNGVRTDDDGNAVLQIDVDFPIDDGAYPFHKFADFDPDDERYKAEVPSAHPVAIVNSATGDVDAPFMIRLVSHCTDNLAHGLEPAAREPWFAISGL